MSKVRSLVRFRILSWLVLHRCTTGGPDESTLLRRPFAGSMALCEVSPRTANQAAGNVLGFRP